MSDGTWILIVGGGYGCLHTALRLERLLRLGEAIVTLAGPRSYLTYQPLLTEAAAGSLEPSTVVVPLRRTRVIKGVLRSIDHTHRGRLLHRRRRWGDRDQLRPASTGAGIGLRRSPGPRAGQGRPGHPPAQPRARSADARPPSWMTHRPVSRGAIVKSR